MAVKAAPRNTAVARNVSRLRAPPPNRSRRPAPSSASVQLLTNQHSTIPAGTPLWNWTARCAANTAAITTGHERRRVATRPPSRMAFGGHSMDTGTGASVSANPSLAPR